MALRCFGCDAVVSNDGSVQHQNWCRYGKNSAALLSLADALAEAARQFNDAMNGFECDGEQLRDLSNALKERIAAWDAARKAGR